MPALHAAFRDSNGIILRNEFTKCIGPIFDGELSADESEQTLHASGHPCQGELADLYKVLRPTLAIPVHGEADHMKANAKVARESGVDVTLTGTNGDLFYLSPTPGVRRRYAEVGRLQWCEETERLISVT